MPILRRCRAIKPSELIGQAWNKKDKEVLAPNVLAMIYRFNQVNHWVMRTVVETENHAERVDVILFFLEVLRELYALNNFNGVMELVSSLQASAIDRLKLTWGEISSKKRRILEECAELMTREKNFANFRTKLATCEPPVVPFFGKHRRSSGRSNRWLLFFICPSSLVQECICQT